MWVQSKNKIILYHFESFRQKKDKCPKFHIILWEPATASLLRKVLELFVLQSTTTISPGTLRVLHIARACARETTSASTVNMWAKHLRATGAFAASTTMQRGELPSRILSRSPLSSRNMLNRTRLKMTPPTFR